MASTSFVGKRQIFALSLAILPLAGCGRTDRIVPTSIPMDDYRTRHPIVLAEARTSVDLFPSWAQRGLDNHTAKQVYSFAEQYHDFGQGPVQILIPRTLPAGRASSFVADIKRVLVLGGARSGVVVSTYPAADPKLASTVRLSFSGVKATVADQCGQWPNDLASASSIEGWENKPYWNLGCSTQTMIAAQTSDPRDLVSPRGEDPPDTLIRSRGIEAVRKGSDPNTNWLVRNSNIGGIGGS